MGDVAATRTTPSDGLTLRHELWRQPDMLRVCHGHAVANYDKKRMWCLALDVTWLALAC